MVWRWRNRSDLLGAQSIEVNKELEFSPVVLQQKFSMLEEVCRVWKWFWFCAHLVKDKCITGVFLSFDDRLHSPSIQKN